MKKFILGFFGLTALTASLWCLDIPRPAGWVSDNAGIIQPREKQLIERIAASLEKNTGAEIAVVTLKSLNDENLEDLSNKLFEKWGIGKKNENNGILVLVSLQERQIRIETGYGIEQIIPDAFAGRIIRDYITPSFQKGEYSAGLLLGVAHIAQAIADSKGVKLEIDRPVGQQLSDMTVGQKIFSAIIFIFLLILFIRNPFLFLLLLSSGMGRGGGRGFGGGFGGFGGGLSGGGGASGRW